MESSLSTAVDRPLAEVFAFLEDMRNHPQKERSQVMLVERLTPEPVIQTKLHRQAAFFVESVGEKPLEASYWGDIEQRDLTRDS